MKTNLYTWLIFWILWNPLSFSGLRVENSPRRKISGQEPDIVSDLFKNKVRNNYLATLFSPGRGRNEETRRRFRLGLKGEGERDCIISNSDGMTVSGLFLRSPWPLRVLYVFQFPILTLVRWRDALLIVMCTIDCNSTNGKSAQPSTKGIKGRF